MQIVSSKSKHMNTFLPRMLTLKKYFIFSLILRYFAVSLTRIIVDEDAHLTTPELIVKNGYPVETHYVMTSDRYILTLHRIPALDNSTKKVVLLQHGIFSSSASWIDSGSGSLGYLLSNEGYDVWLGNSRGNKYSRNHTCLTADNFEYWNFSWHEMGVFDLPATIDYILEITNQSKLFYVGYSQGTTIFYVMASEKPEYNDKIIAQFSLGPIAFMKNMKSPMYKFFARMSGAVNILFLLFNMNSYRPNILRIVDECTSNEITMLLCKIQMFLISGISIGETDSTLLPVYMAHADHGASRLQLLHFAQIIESGRFCQFDWEFDNCAKYGSVMPPSYNLSSITAPVYLIYSKHDWIACEEGVFQLCDSLGDSCIEKFVIESGFINRFNHLDLLSGENAPELIFSKIIEWMNTF